MEELALIFSDKATTDGRISTQSGQTENIQRFVPGTDSGTYDFFIEEVMVPAYENDAEAAGAGSPECR
jgi:ABC-type phosphate transport system substrate-binding protein